MSSKSNNNNESHYKDFSSLGNSKQTEKLCPPFQKALNVENLKDLKLNEFSTFLNLEIQYYEATFERLHKVVNASKLWLIGCEDRKLAHSCAHLSDQLSDFEFLNLLLKEMVRHQTGYLPADPSSQQLALANDDQLKEFASRNSTNKTIADALRIARYADFKLDPKDLTGIEAIGAGNFSKVYKAYWQGCKVALKILNKDQHLSREVVTLKRLRHSNIVLFLAASVNEFGESYIITEFVEITLDRFVQEQVCLTPNKMWDFAQKISSGLHYLHSLDIVHMDLKPDNILINPRSITSHEVKIADFGLALNDPTHILSLSSINNSIYNRDILVMAVQENNMNILKKLDVYLFGRVLEFMFQPQKQYSHQFQQLVDIYILCTDPDNDKRPTIDYVFKKLDLGNPFNLEQAQHANFFEYGGVKTRSFVIERHQEKLGFKPADIVTQWAPNPEQNEIAYPEIYKKYHKKFSQDVLDGKIQNNIIFGLHQVLQVRNEGEERQELRMIFKRGNYLHHRSMSGVWQALDDRTKWEEIEHCSNYIHPKFSTSFGVQIGIITKDNYLIFSRRAKNLVINPGLVICTMTEGMSSADVDENGNPDIFNTAKRGLKEELDLEVKKKDIHLTTLFNNFVSFHVGFYGYVDFRQPGTEMLTFDQVEERWKNGPKDKYETSNLEAIPFNLDAVKNFIIEKNISGGTLAGLVQLLATHFGGNDIVRAAFQAAFKSNE